MSAPVDLGEVHSRLSGHIADLDRLRQGIVDTLTLIGGNPLEDWSLGQLRELWAWVREHPLVLEVLSQVALAPGEWVAFRSIIPTESDQPRARNELGALTRAIRRQRGEVIPLYDREQSVETGYAQAYRMPVAIARHIAQILEEDA